MSVKTLQSIIRDVWKNDSKLFLNEMVANKFGYNQAKVRGLILRIGQTHDDTTKKADQQEVRFIQYLRRRAQMHDFDDFDFSSFEYVRQESATETELIDEVTLTSYLIENEIVLPISLRAIDFSLLNQLKITNKLTTWYEQTEQTDKNKKMFALAVALEKCLAPDDKYPELLRKLASFAKINNPFDNDEYQEVIKERVNHSKDWFEILTNLLFVTK